MYKILKAVGIDKYSLGDWTELEAGSSPIFLLFLKYEKVLIKLSNTVSLESGWMNIYDLPAELRTSGMKMEDYLARAKPYTIKLYTETADSSATHANYVRSLFANDYGFKQKMVNRNLHPDSDLAPDQMLDLLISHDEIEDYKSIVDNALFTVNGLVHRATAIEQGIMIYEGARTQVKSNDNRVGILDFKGMGGLTVYPFQDDWLVVHEGKEIYKAAYFKVPFDLTGKSVALVMGGFLYFLNPVLDIVGNDVMKINFRFIDLIDQFYSNYEKIFYPEDFPLTRHPIFTDRFVTKEFHTEEYIRAALKLSQSFFVVVNTPKLIIKTIRLDNCQQPGQYRAYSKDYPDLPVKIGHGYLPEFNVVPHNGFYTLACPHYLQEHAVRYKSDISDYKLVRDQQHSSHPVSYAQASQLLILDGGSL